jgi:predicted AAA+ superfamily ATPase
MPAIQPIAYKPRIVDSELDALLPALSAIAIEGAKGVGKTATATRRAASIIRLDDPARRVIVEADSAAILSDSEAPVLLDEWQQVPAVWDAVRRAVDGGAPPGRYILTGSASPRERPTHSGAGRIVSLRMRPMTLVERGVAAPTISLRALLSGSQSPLAGTTSIGLIDYVGEILRSGFPALRSLEGRGLRAQLDSYLERIVNRDFKEQGVIVRRPETLRRWMTAYAAATSTTASLEKIRDAATGDEREKPAKSTGLLYREVLEQLWIVDPVLPWLPSNNHLTVLAQAPKHQLVDPALAARLLRVDAEALLEGTPLEGSTLPLAPRDSTLLGRLFEALVTLDVRVYAQAAETSVHHLRTHAGRQEVDLIVARDARRVLAIEVKLGANVDDDDVKHLRWLREQIGKDLLDALVITTGPQAYRRRDGIGVVPAALLGP